MSIKKKLLAVAAAGALTAATAVPAMALENEFHGMFKFFTYQTNFFNGSTFATGAAAQAHLKRGANSGLFAEQRARLQYIAKANDDLKLVTHFELDSRFGGVTGGYKGTTGNDAGNLDADQLTLETKNVYLDFNCPITGTNVKAGIQPWADSYKSLFLLADMTGVYATKKFDPLTVSLGWFRFNDQDAAGDQDPGKKTADLIVLDGKYAVTKDLTVGVNYYNVQNDASATSPAFELLHMVGANAAAKFGPAAVDVFAGYQFGDFNKTSNRDISAYIAGTTGKVKAGPGSVNFAAIYLSGEGNTTTGDRGDFQTISGPTTYFNPANMWLLIRNGQAVNSSTSVLGTDNTVGGRGLWGIFAGYEGTVNKLFYNANVGYAETAHARSAVEKKSLGTEVNAQVGYKLYDNLTASVAAAYLLLGDGLGGKSGQVISGFGVIDATNPYMANVQLSYVF
ncbi:MAG: hypothetical protein FD174_1815 [Geobacteraceae bacterium]|nr:MAG: hypothetical protein FD174_1815 [Geobacteraceae bacterium]